MRAGKRDPLQLGAPVAEVLERDALLLAIRALRQPTQFPGL
jgi:hypothetical protein